MMDAEEKMCRIMAIEKAMIFYMKKVAYYKKRVGEISDEKRMEYFESLVMPIVRGMVGEMVNAN